MSKTKKEIKSTDTRSREELKQQVISKAETNPAAKIKVVEESADIVHLVLPQKLEAASGGCVGCDGVGGCQDSCKFVDFGTADELVLRLVW